MVAAMAATVTSMAIPALAHAAAAPTQAGALASWECPPGSVCLYDDRGGNRRFYAKADGCWFDNIGLQGLGDRAESIRNRTRHKVNLANWNGRAWEHLVSAAPGEMFNLGPSVRNKTDAVHVIC
ncbi:peptidase inhibitor family I36 protein [Actinomadura graeca]|uniref:Peptidase inhibitor family I36 protein n=2 Tax=Actinomadura graeca TaxID=2750812 RepID=A0ABX8RCV3_9ACTN|nr:peptidase inhibitor family I36 protein [Actinomadura graeca]